ncbi:MAG: glycosyltransferase family 2 protein [Candidatus Omnitrophica bacterium]|nr:glycosyltransferase family 2 protein [Candidatus Omnitrophota bacterium]
MTLSVVIPVHNEETAIDRVTLDLMKELSARDIPHEIILVNDNSTDASPRILDSLRRRYESVKVVHAAPPKGFGKAVSTGLRAVTGEGVVIYMGDASDDPRDVVMYYRKLCEGYDCVFGSRFLKGSKVRGYPRVKLLLNRAGNLFIQLMFCIRYNDISNAFKAYRTGVIRSVEPLVSRYFNITVEIPLKAIIRGYSYCVVPISWNGRNSGVSKYHIRELSRKYFFSILYVWLEKLLLSREIEKAKGGYDQDKQI